MSLGSSNPCCSACLQEWSPVGKLVSYAPQLIYSTKRSPSSQSKGCVYKSEKAIDVLWKRVNKSGFPSSLSAAPMSRAPVLSVAVNFTPTASLLALYIHFGWPMVPPPHSPSPVRGFPAACHLPAHTWPEDVTGFPKKGELRLWRCNRSLALLQGRDIANTKQYERWNNNRISIIGSFWGVGNLKIDVIDGCHFGQISQKTDLSKSKSFAESNATEMSSLFLLQM